MNGSCLAHFWVFVSFNFILTIKKRVSAGISVLVYEDFSSSSSDITVEYLTNIR